MSGAWARVNPRRSQRATDARAHGTAREAIMDGRTDTL
jgi:hypothetical protein